MRRRQSSCFTGILRRIIPTGLVFILVLCLVPQAVSADPGDPLWGYQKLFSSDHGASDRFGSSVALDGDTALVGAYGVNFSRGSASIFTRSGESWTEQVRLSALDGADGDQFGTSVALDGDTALVGASGKYDIGILNGAAYVFTRSGGSWTQQAKLTASDGAAFDQFGNSVALDGNTALVGAYTKSDWGSFHGAAYVFTRSGGVWIQQAKLTASDGASSDYFGTSVALDGDTALVGAYLRDDVGTNSGAAYVFTRSNGVWTQQVKLTASDGAAWDAFGYSVALDGDTALVGAFRDDSARGSAYVFTRSGGVWSEQAKLTASDGAGGVFVAGDSFGTSVDLDGDTALVGANRVDSDRGSAYIFTRSGGSWTEQVKLTAPDGTVGDQFGSSVALDGDTVLVGAPGDDELGISSGSAYFIKPSDAAAGADTADVVHGKGPVTVDVLANDAPTTGSMWHEDTFEFTQPAHGTAVKGSIIYTPTPGYVGEDSLTYSICDTFHVCVEGTVTFNVLAAPVVETEAEEEPVLLPATGFAPGVVTKLPAQPQEKAYAGTPMTLEIPALGVAAHIVGVPLSEGEWDLAWLGDQVGYLNGTTFPTWAGNTALTGHVVDAHGRPGPFAGLSTLRYGDRVLLHAWGKVYGYEVRETLTALPTNLRPVTQHEEYDWLTLVTCKGYDQSQNRYRWRQIVRAVLVDVAQE